MKKGRERKREGDKAFIIIQREGGGSEEREGGREEERCVFYSTNHIPT